MVSARYFRLISLEVYGYRFNLTLSELRLYASGSAVDGSATMSCVGTPTDGSLANLIDGNTATSCTFDGAEVVLPGFYLQWDLGSTTAVDEMHVTGVSQATWLHRFTLQSSDDAITWIDISAGRKTQWPGAAVAAVMSVPVSGLVDAELMLRGDGDNLSTAIVDSRSYPKRVTVYGNACISTSYSVFGGSSLHFDGAGDYVEVLDPFEFGGGDLTVQFWLKTSTTSTYAGVIGKDDGSFPVGAWALLLNGNGSGSIQLWNASYSRSAPLLNSAAVGVNDDTFHHIALVRYGSAWAIYKDGVSIATNTWSGSMAYLSLSLNIGRDPGYSRDFNGYIDDLCISLKAEYTGNFTPPSAPIVISDATPPRPRADSSGVRFTGPTVGNVQQSINVRTTNLIADNANGVGTITGTVKEKALPTNLPLSRKVRLMREWDGKRVRETWSDATTGAYTFTGLDVAQVYTAIASDHLRKYRATVADNLAATR